MIRDKKGQSIGRTLIIGVFALAFIFIVYMVFAAPMEKVRTELNSTSYDAQEQGVINHVSTTHKWTFIILALSVIIWMIVSAISNQPREYYL